MAEPDHDEAQDAQDLGLDGFRRPVEDQGLTLDELTGAFARMVDRGSDPYEPLPRSAVPGVPGDGDSVYAFEDSITGDECPVSPRTILEAMLFVGRSTNEPLTSTQVAAMMRGVRPQEIDSLVTELNAAYDEEGCPYGIVSTGSGYRLTLHEEYARLRDKFHGRVKEARLSQSAVDVLAIVAYRQPLTRDEIEQLAWKGQRRRVGSTGASKTLADGAA